MRREVASAVRGLIGSRAIAGKSGRIGNLLTVRIGSSEGSQRAACAEANFLAYFDALDAHAPFR